MELSPQEQLRAVEGAPVLRRAASGRERLGGVASVVALYAVLAITLMHRPPWFLTAVVMVGAFLVIVGWAWFQLDVPGRRPHNVAERWLPTVACAQLAAPGTTILDGLPASTGKALAMSAFPAIALAAYLVCRWRR